MVFKTEKKHLRREQPRPARRGRWHAGLLAGVYALISFIVAISLSWILLAQFNFAYGLWHDLGGIGAGIDQYGPKNRYKPGFGETTRAQRLALFAQINHSVHNQGEGLEAIFYETPASNGRQLLLREPEVVHLQDVAILIDRLSWLAGLTLAAWILMSYYYWQNGALPRLAMQLKGLGLVLAPAFVAMLIVGPETLFNAFHVWVFPKDHQWFFYYQESLMSTLMLAPTLFGWIAAAMLLTSLGCFALLQAGMLYLARNTRQL